MITSLTNAKVKELYRLHQKKYRQKEYLVIEKKMVFKAYEKGLIKEVIGLSSPFDDTPFLKVSKEVLNKLSLNEDVDFIALVKKEERSVVEGDVLILDDVKDPGNLGLMIKTMHAFNFKTLILSPFCCDLYDEKVLKSAKDSFYDINVIRGELLDIISDLKKRDYMLIATALKDRSIDFNELKIKSPCAIIMGNEGSGVKEEILERVPYITKIQMANMDSLNVAIAASIIMHKANSAR